MSLEDSFPPSGPMVTYMIDDDSQLSHQQSSNENNLDDIFGSASSSPSCSSGLNDEQQRMRNEISDIPRLRSEHSTAGYRDGLSAAKSTTIQAGFDEGYGLGAVIGLRVGTILGTIEGIYAAIVKTGEGMEISRIRSLVQKSRKELTTEEVFGRQWWGEDGIWKFDVVALDGIDVTFRDIAEAHPLLRKWDATVKIEVAHWNMDVAVMEDVEVNRGDDDQPTG